MGRMKHQAIVGNIGHFDNEIDMAGLASVPASSGSTSSRRSTSGASADGHSIIVLSEGRLLNLGNATGHPSFVMSNSFTNQTIAQIELFTKNDEYQKKVYVLPKHLDEKVARLHLDALGAKLTELAPSRPPTSASRSRARTSRSTTATSVEPTSTIRRSPRGAAADRMGGGPDAGPPLDPRALQGGAAARGREGGRCPHVTAETANLMQALTAGGAEAALCSANPLTTQDEVAAALVDLGVPVQARPRRGHRVPTRGTCTRWPTGSPTSRSTTAPTCSS